MLQNKQRIVKYLTIASVLLLLGNIAVNRYIAHKTAPDELTTEYLNARFEAMLKEFGVQKEWISTKSINKQAPDSLETIYKLKLPTDLPTPFLLNQMNNEFYDLPVRITSIEKSINGPALVKVYYRNSVMLQADIEFDPDARRTASSVGFLVTDTEDLNDKDFKKLLDFSEHFAIILKPSQKSIDLKQQIVSSGKEYVLMLDDEIDEMEYDLEEDFNKNRLKSSVRAIVGAFTDAKLYTIDDQSDLYTSSLSGFLNDEFKRRKLPLIPMKRFARIEGDDDEELQSNFRYMCRSLHGGENRVFLIKAEDLNILESEIDNLRKKGYKFILPSSVEFGL